MRLALRLAIAAIAKRHLFSRIVASLSERDRCKSKVTQEFAPQKVQHYILPGCKLKADLQEIVLHIQKYTFEYDLEKRFFDAGRDLESFYSNDIANSMYHDFIPNFACYTVLAHDKQVGFEQPLVAAEADALAELVGPNANC